MRTESIPKGCFAIAAFSLLTVVASAAPVATYDLQGNTNATQGGVPALSIVLDGGAASSAFVNDTVLGSSRQVLALTGVGGTDAGLQFNNSGALLSSTIYSVELIFQYTQNPGGFKKILDSANRGPDSGFYVDPSSHLDVFPSGAGSATWTNNVYHQVVLSVNSGSVSAFLDGGLDFTVASSVMNIDANNLLSFFLDDNATGRNEFSSSRVARIQLFNQALGQPDVTTLWNNGNPFSAGSGVPEPSTWITLGGGLLALAGVRFRRLR